MVSHADARLSEARGAIARACLDALPDAQLGDIILGSAQRRIVARAERALRDHGGCLIGEDVGRGKTFISLALARRWRGPMLVAPAALRSTWAGAQVRAGVACQFISHESLSRRRAPTTAYDLLIVDESHHLRNPATTRFEVLARMAATVPIVLLSATPLQNRTRDLAAQIALFHGEAAFQLSAHALARFVIRGEDPAGDDMPVVVTPEWIPVDADDGAVLAALLDLPSPPRPLDGGDAGALRMITLVRAWASSRAALKGMLRSRRRLATAIAQGVEVGRTPTRRETREWRASEDVVQLGLAEVLMQQSAESALLVTLRAQLDDEDIACANVLAALASTVDPDMARISAIRALRIAHPGCRIVAFSEYASTVTAYFDALRNDPGVGAITAKRALIATGAIPRDEMLARFAPRAQGVGEHAWHDAVTLLLTTDLVSEGVNLQDASVVLHLDLPWNPARLAQRVGRVRRPGGAGLVRSFLLAPPAQADVLLAADARLRHKLDQARHVVGPTFAVLPSAVSPSMVAAHAPDNVTQSATAEGRLVGVLQGWAIETARNPSQDPVVGATVHSSTGWLAALADGRLIGSVQGMPSERVEYLLKLVELADEAPRVASGDEVEDALAALRGWIADEQLLRSCGVGGGEGPLRRRAHAFLGRIVGSARRHEQALMVGLAGRVRHHLAAPMPLGAERAVVTYLETAASNPACAGQMLAQALSALDAGLLARLPEAVTEHDVAVVAIIIIGPEGVGDGQPRYDTRDDCVPQPSRAV